MELEEDGTKIFVCTVDEVSQSFKGGKGEAGRNLVILVKYLLELATS